jgi:predicted O-methyltransferase YrrM
MDTSLTQKIFSAARSLLRHPTQLPRYLAHLPCWRRSPLDLQLPWFSYGAIDFLARTLQPTQEVFEFGSGGSSVFLARRTRSVISVENDPVWHGITTARTRSLGLTNLACELHVFGDAEAARYPELPYFRALEGRRFDVIVVDGYCGFTTGPYGALRPHCFRLALQAIRPGGLIVVDDYWMYPEFADLAPQAKLTVFEGMGPCRYGTTSTAVFEF